MAAEENKNIQTRSYYGTLHDHPQKAIMPSYLLQIINGLNIFLAQQKTDKHYLA